MIYSDILKAMHAEGYPVSKKWLTNILHRRYVADTSFVKGRRAPERDFRVSIAELALHWKRSKEYRVMMQGGKAEGWRAGMPHIHNDDSLGVESLGLPSVEPAVDLISKTDAVHHEVGVGASEGQLRELFSIIRRKDQQIERLLDWVGLQKELAREASELVGRVQPLCVPDDVAGDHGRWCEYFLLLSDWHVGNGYAHSLSRYDEAMLRGLVAVLGDKVRRCITDAPLPVKALNIMVLGDMVEGDGIHAKQHTELLYPTYRQVEVFVQLFSEMLSTFASFVPTVRVFCVKGNHGRSGDKHSSVHPGSNWDMAAYVWTRDRCSDIPNVRFWVGEEGSHMIKKLNDVQLVLSHGDHIKINNRVPYYSLEDYMRSTAEWFCRDEYAHRLIFAGHLHVPFAIQSESATLYANGALPGYTEYAKNGRFTPQPRVQILASWAWGVEPNRPIELSCQKLWLGAGVDTTGVEVIDEEEL